MARPKTENTSTTNHPNHIPIPNPDPKHSLEHTPSQLGASTPDNLGDDPREVEALSSIALGDGATVLAPLSPGFRFNNPTDQPVSSPRDIGTGAEAPRP